MSVFVLAFLGLGNLASVAEFLSQAEWAVLKSPECGHRVYQRLHRSLGRLHIATGNLDAALVNFANDVCAIFRTVTINYTQNTPLPSIPNNLPRLLHSKKEDCISFPALGEPDRLVSLFEKRTSEHCLYLGMYMFVLQNNIGVVYINKHTSWNLNYLDVFPDLLCQWGVWFGQHRHL